MKLKLVILLSIFFAVKLFAGVNNDGSFSYSYPIELPPSPNGITPSISLEYNSNTENGICGVGWELKGYSSIVEDHHYGNNGLEKVYDSEWGKIIKPDDSAPYTYLFQDLKVDCGSTAMDGWTVASNDGRIYTFTYHKERIDWRRHNMLTKVEDKFGNYYTIEYREIGNQFYPEVIKYTLGNEYAEVLFQYESREDDVYYYNGARFFINKRLKKISVKKGGSLLKEYNFCYNKDEWFQNESTLLSVTVSTMSTDGVLRSQAPTKFDWDESIKYGGITRVDGYSAVKEKIKLKFENSIPEKSVLEERVYVAPLELNNDGLQDYLIFLHHNRTFELISMIHTGNPTEPYKLVYSDIFDTWEGYGLHKDTHMQNSNTQFMYRDFNGDKYDDFVIVRQDNKLKQDLCFIFLFSDGEGRFTFDSENVVLFPSVEGVQYIFGGHWDGDDKEDIVIMENRTGVDEYTNEINGYILHSMCDKNYVSFTSHPFNLQASSDDTGILSSCDINGDGMLDIVSVKAGWLKAPRALVSFEDSNQVYYTTFLNNGENGFEYVDGSGYSSIKQVTIDEWSEHTSDCHSIGGRRFYLQDMNGDGFCDLFLTNTHTKYLGDDHYYIRNSFFMKSNGRTFEEPQCESTNITGDPGGTVTPLGDINGDGLVDSFIPDMFEHHSDDKSKYTHEIMLGTGDPHFNSKRSVIECDEVEYGFKLDRAIRIASDLNGDNVSDFINMRFENENEQRYLHYFALMSKSRGKKLLSQIVKPSGTSVKIDYSAANLYGQGITLSGDGIGGDKKTRIITRRVYEGYVDSTENFISRKRIGYEYFNWMVGDSTDYFQKGALGFEKVTALSKYSSDRMVEKKKTYYSKEFLFKGRLVQEEYYHGSNSSTPYIWKKYKYSYTKNRSYRVKLNSEVEYDNDRQILVVNNYSYTGNGNLPSKLDSRAFLSSNVSIENEILNKNLSELESIYGLCQKHNEKILKYCRNAHGKHVVYPETYVEKINDVVISSSKFNESLGGLNLEIYQLVDKEKDVWLKTVQVKNQDGTLRSIKVSDKNKTEFEYDYSDKTFDNGFLVRTKSGGQIAETFLNLVHRNVLKAKFSTGKTYVYSYNDPYGRMTQIKDYTYDDLGEVVLTSSYKGLKGKVTSHYVYGGIDFESNPVIPKYSRDYTNSYTISENFDDRGRVIESRKTTFLKELPYHVRPQDVAPYNWLEVVQSDFNPDGSLKSTNRYSSATTFGSSISKKMLYQYDSLGRLISVDYPNNRKLEFSYDYFLGGVKKNILDSRGGKSKKISYLKYSLKNKIRKIEPNGNELVLTYNDNEQLTSVQDAGNGVTEISYNTIGWKTTIKDPDTGIHTYEYCDDGSISSVTDATGRKVEYYYGADGKPVQEKYSQAGKKQRVIDFQYFSNSGQVATVKDGLCKHSYEYDLYGNIVMVKRTMGDEFSYNNTSYTGRSFLFVIKHDSQGRVVSLNYPKKGVSVAREFTGDGSTLAAVRTIPEGFDLVRYSKYMKDENVDVYNNQFRVLGNGVLTQRSYDAVEGHLKSVFSYNTSSDEQQTIEDLNYVHDQFGNLNKVNDIDGVLSADYQYDSLSRLERFNRKNTQINYKYSNSGNMEIKGRNTYEYTSSHKHAVTIIDTGEKVYHYLYDDAGRMTRRKAKLTTLPSGAMEFTGGQYLDYDVTGRLVKISGVDLPTEEYYYDYTGARVVKKRTEANGKETTTISIDGLYEETEISGTSGYIQNTWYALGRNNELVMQYTEQGLPELLVMSDSIVYNNIYRKQTLRDNACILYWKTTDYLYSPEILMNLVILIYGSISLLLLISFIENSKKDGFGSTFRKKGRAYMTILMFSGFSAFYGCEVPTAGTQNKPEWLREENDEEVDPNDWDDDFGNGDDFLGDDLDNKPEDPISGDKVETLTAACGNGVVEEGEGCDDGNLFDGDGCSSNCAIESGIGDNSTTKPSDGGNNDDGCSSNCAIESGIGDDSTTKPSDGGNNGNGNNGNSGDIEFDITGVPQQGVLFFHSDYTGNISYTTNSSGSIESRMLYLPYGQIAIEGKDASRYKFNSHERDKTGLSFFNVRYYDAELGRFITPDPTVPNPLFSQSYNRYMAVFGNPISYIDKSGYSPEDAVERIVTQDTNGVASDVVQMNGEVIGTDATGNPVILTSEFTITPSTGATTFQINISDGTQTGGGVSGFSTGSGAASLGSGKDAMQSGGAQQYLKYINAGGASRVSGVSHNSGLSGRDGFSGSGNSKQKLSHDYGVYFSAAGALGVGGDAAATWSIPEFINSGYNIFAPLALTAQVAVGEGGGVAGGIYYAYGNASGVISSIDITITPVNFNFSGYSNGGFSFQLGAAAGLGAIGCGGYTLDFWSK